MATPTVLELLAGDRASDPVESVDVERVLDLALRSEDPWSQDISLHVIASAIVVHPVSGLILLRWHTRQPAWLRIGCHGDLGETDPIRRSRSGRTPSCSGWRSRRPGL